MHLITRGAASSRASACLYLYVSNFEFFWLMALPSMGAVSVQQ